MISNSKIPALLVLLLCGPALAQDVNLCDQPGEAPDLVVSDIVETRRFGSVGGITGFSLGTDTCNLGSCRLNYSGLSDQHPVLAQNLFRLEGGKLEQIGQSWAAHRFVALSGTLCSPSCVGAGSGHLGVDCSTRDIAVYAGGQTLLGRRSEVNPYTGQLVFPPTDQSLMGDDVFRRLQVHNADLDPASHPDAIFFVETVSIAADDAAAGNATDNASYRQVDVVASEGELDIQLTGLTEAGAPAIMAWAADDPEVQIRAIDLPGDGRLLVGSRATPLGNGRWHYEYAIENLDSHRAVGSFEAPLPLEDQPGHVGFHDVDYHSGEVYDGTDWAPAVHPGGTPALRWATSSFDVDADANALRWGTLYNFRFDSAAPPAQSSVTLGLFLPGTPTEVAVPAVAPGSCDGDGQCESGENGCSCPADCGAVSPFELACDDGLSDDCDGLIDCADPDCCSPAPCNVLDADGDGFLACTDCDDSDSGVWSLPGPVEELLFLSDAQTLGWNPPTAPGAGSVAYRVLRSGDPGDFYAAASCLTGGGTGTTALDITTPDAAEVFFYLVQAVNGCPFGDGSLGSDSNGALRGGLACP